MRLLLRALVVIGLVLSLASCKRDWEPRSLSPYPNPFGPSDPLWAEQPHRENPLEVVVNAAGTTAYVSLQGSPDEPGEHVVVVDLASGTVRARIEVGSGPTGLALHPSEPYLLVANRFSNYISVIDTRSLTVVNRLPADYYNIELAFTPDGSELWISNRWRDAVAVWSLGEGRRGLEVVERWEPGVPVDTNPRDLVISEDGATVVVASLTGMSVSIIDRAARSERARVELGAPANGLALIDDLLVVATLSASTHHQPYEGPDTDGDDLPGDGTPNINFQDLQNELTLIDVGSGEEKIRYTSDSICCKDYRDVDPADSTRFGDLLPLQEQWIVGGALPEQLAIDRSQTPPQLWVTYSGSNELQSFDIDTAAGTLTPGPVYETAGHNPHGVAVMGNQVLVAHRLSETLGTYSSATGELQSLVEVGDLSGGPFPATDAEIGELFNFVTAGFSIDGDQTCQHCHREGGNIDKAFSMPLTRYAGRGLRQTMAYRGMSDSRPWFFEAAMDQTNFVPVMNEFARIENFCCSDYTLWPGGAPQACSSNPPPECSEASNAWSDDGSAATRTGPGSAFAHPRPSTSVTRDAFYLQAINELIGRSESFGDGLYWEDPITREHIPLPLNFDGITRALGLFLLQGTNLLPNPNDKDLGSVRRGAALFEDLKTGCALCHPAPSFSLVSGHGGGLPLTMGPVVTPVRAEDGTNLDLFASGFSDIFPRTEMDSCEDVCGEELCAQSPTVCDDLRNVRFGVTTLRGIWDRAPSMLHHGRAKGLRETICTPGHPALQPGERGFNEHEGIPDTHGGTSHLTAGNIADLIDYLETL